MNQAGRAAETGPGTHRAGTGDGTGEPAGRVAVVFRDDAGRRPAATTARARLAPVLTALAGLGLAAEPVAYSDARAEQVRGQLLAVDGVLAWVDPVAPGGDRVILDDILRQAARAGVWIGSHPDVIARMGTKEVLYHTRELGWGSDVQLYRTPGEFRQRFRPAWPPTASGCSRPAGATEAAGCGRSCSAAASAEPRSLAPATGSACSTPASGTRPAKTCSSGRSWPAARQPSLPTPGPERSSTRPSPAVSTRASSAATWSRTAWPASPGNLPGDWPPENARPQALIRTRSSGRQHHGPPVRQDHVRSRRAFLPAAPPPARARLGTGHANPPRHRHHLASGLVGRRLPVRPQDRRRARHLPPLRDQRQFRHALPARSPARAGAYHQAGREDAQAGRQEQPGLPVIGWLQVRAIWSCAPTAGATAWLLSMCCNLPGDACWLI